MTKKPGEDDIAGINTDDNKVNIAQLEFSRFIIHLSSFNRNLEQTTLDQYLGLTETLPSYKMDFYTRKFREFVKKR